MSLRDILVFADNTPEGVARVEMANALARSFDAHLEANVLTPLPTRPMYVAANSIADVFTEARAASVRASEEALKAINAAVKENALFSAHRHDVEAGAEEETAAAIARTADLVVLAKPELGDKSHLDSKIFMGALLSGGRPCLVLPRWPKPHAWGKRALIAWKGTPEAARAVSAAMPLLARADVVRISLVDPRGARFGEDERSLERLATALIRHGVTVEATLERRTGDLTESVEATIAGDIESFGADLLVMGGYGHSRLREWVFGGMTQAMIANAAIPILISH